MVNLKDYAPFTGLLIFGNIENLILASQGVVKGANPVKLAIASICFVIMWLFIGTVGTVILMKYASVIEFIGGLAIVILGLQSMIGAFQFNKDENYD